MGREGVLRATNNKEGIMASHKERVLVVDDEEGVRNMVRESLSFLGISCSTASNAEEALEIIQREPFDLILSDIRMPGMDGLELLQRIKEDHPDVHVIIMTGYVEEYSFIDVIKAGANDFILKPFRIKELRAKIERCFSEDLKEREILRLRNLAAALAEKNKQLGRKIKESSKKGNGRITEKAAEEYAAICGSVAHSLKNEFLNIGSSMKSIRELSSDSPDIQEELDIVERSLGYSQIHLQRVLDYVELGKPRLERVDVLELLKRTESLAEPRSPSDIELETTIDPDMKGQTVYANFEQLMGVLLELVHNATNALHRKGGTIRLHWEERNGEIAISVKDNGPGIPEELRKGLFKKQVSSKKGMGLGLFLANKVISVLGGKLNLEASSEEGTTITIRLPVANDEKEP